MKRSFAGLPILLVLLLAFLLASVLPIAAQGTTTVPGKPYQVQSGDTPASIATKFHITVTCLRDANNLSSLDTLPASVTQLIIPDDCSKVGSAATAVTPTPETLTATSVPTSTPEPTKAVLTDQTYIVKSGDRLSKIADSFGVTVNCLVQANRIANPNLIYTGQQLLITASCQGGGGGSTTSASTTSTSGNRAACAFDRNPGRQVVDGKYTVVAGDSLDFIGCDLGISLACLRASNPQVDGPLAIGETINIDLSCPGWTAWPGAGEPPSS